MLREQNGQQCAKITALTAANAHHLRTGSPAQRQQAKTVVEQRSKTQDELQLKPQDREFVITEIRKKYVAMKEAYGRLKEDFEQAKKELCTAKGDLQQQLLHNQQLVKASNIAHAQLEKKERLLVTAEAEKRNAAMEAEGLAQQLQKLAKLLENRDRALQQSERTIQEGHAECDRLQQDRARLRRAAAEHHAVLEEVRSRWEESERRAVEANAENQRLERALAASTHRNANPRQPTDARATCTCAPVPAVVATHCGACGGTGLQLATVTTDIPQGCSMHETPARAQRAAPHDFATPQPRQAPAPAPSPSPGAALQALRNSNSLLMNRLIGSVTMLHQATNGQ